ncbi:MAG: tRNA (adenosine(37)-N6)-threonylcarbamoyltransferase complex dimerization subunit type 1 TsaB [Planctomycetota bacterium]|jgi:tRNA threonylcarbamoyladenosine biosynthesis protein TsaB
MKVIGIETAGKTGSVGAAWEGGKRERVFPHGNSHGRDLAPEMQTLVTELEWDLAGIDLIAVGVGPGSYTGLRIGMAFAKALALALEKPLVGVSTFEAMVQQGPEGEKVLAPVLDARWGQMYTAAFRWEGDAWRRVVEEAVGPPEKMAANMPEGVCFFGPGVPEFSDILKPRGSISPAGPWDRARADEVAVLGGGQFRAQGAGDPDRLQPMYLRPTQAEVKRNRDPE